MIKKKDKKRAFLDPISWGIVLIPLSNSISLISKGIVINNTYKKIKHTRAQSIFIEYKIWGNMQHAQVQQIAIIKIFNPGIFLNFILLKKFIR